MIGCFRFCTFIFFISQFFDKYACGLSPLEQHHKIEKKKKIDAHQCVLKIFSFAISQKWQLYFACKKTYFTPKPTVFSFFGHKIEKIYHQKKSLVPMYEMHFPIRVSKP
jgi:hypothetical protein